MTRIELPLFDLKYNKIKERIAHYLELHDNRLIWVLHCYLDIIPKPDDDFFSPKEDQYYSNIDLIVKDKIGSIESYFDNTNEVWVLLISFGVRESDCKFETEESMRIVEKQLHDWWINS